jgi:hypothetical protein
MRDPSLAPFALDTWPLCEPWERAGKVTAGDYAALAAWSERAELELRLEIDRRFDAVADQLELELERRRPRID